MKFEPLDLAGAFLIRPEPATDERGLFARTFCEREFAEAGLPSRFVQCSSSFNRREGTLRGMHWQAEPNAEDKLVRCTSGAIYDVLVDLRPDSPTCGQWSAHQLTAQNRHALLIPRGFAHGFLTLVDQTEVSYQMTAFYEPDAARGFRFDDPDVRIRWPFQPRVMGSRDAGLPPFKDAVRAAKPAPGSPRSLPTGSSR